MQGIVRGSRTIAGRRNGLCRGSILATGGTADESVDLAEQFGEVSLEFDNASSVACGLFGELDKSSRLRGLVAHVGSQSFSCVGDACGDDALAIVRRRKWSTAVCIVGRSPANARNCRAESLAVSAARRISNITSGGDCSPMAAISFVASAARRWAARTCSSQPGNAASRARNLSARSSNSEPTGQGYRSVQEPNPAAT